MLPYKQIAYIVDSQTADVGQAIFTKGAMKMKKRLVSLFLVLVLILSSAMSVNASSRNREPVGNENVGLNNRENSLRLPVIAPSDDVVVLAEQNLVQQREVLMYIPDVFGFTSSELANMQLGAPFSIYVFGENRVLSDEEVLVFPLLYNNNIIGILETFYDEALNQWFFTFGRSYADELNALQQSSYTNRDFVIGRIGDILFASNGEDATVIFNRELEDQLCITVSEMNYLISSVEARAYLDFADITVPITEEVLKISDISESAEIMSANNFRLLSVRHVPQTGVCGVAAWAAILNFRFPTSANYTNASLARAMYNAGFRAATPSMTNYRDYSNLIYNANAVWNSSPLNITQVRNLIDLNRPMMGSWGRTVNGELSLHAVNIIGYEVVSSANMTFYFVRNPWHTHIQSLTVNHSSPTHVVYIDGSFVWTLRQTVH